jgi:hypothetical protein
VANPAVVNPVAGLVVMNLVGSGGGDAAARLSMIISTCTGVVWDETDKGGRAMVTMREKMAMIMVAAPKQPWHPR